MKRLVTYKVPCYKCGKTDQLLAPPYFPYRMVQAEARERHVCMRKAAS